MRRIWNVKGRRNTNIPDWFSLQQKLEQHAQEHNQPQDKIPKHAVIGLYNDKKNASSYNLIIFKVLAIVASF